MSAKKPRKRLLKLHKQQNRLCLWCGMPTIVYADRYLKKSRADSASREHIMPKSMGGTMDDFNIAMSCRKCNGERGDNEKLQPVSHVFELLTPEKQLWMISLMEEMETQP